MRCTVANQYAWEFEIHNAVHPMVPCKHVTCLKRMHEKHSTMEEISFTLLHSLDFDNGNVLEFDFSEWYKTILSKSCNNRVHISFAFPLRQADVLKVQTWIKLKAILR